MRLIWGVVTVLVATAAGCGGRTAGPITRAPAHQLTVQDYDRLEKHIGDAYATLQKHMAAPALPDVARAAEALAVSFGEAERFWTQRDRADAVKWAQQARTLATQTAGAATAGDAAGAAGSIAKLDGTCSQCHAAYREGDAAAGYHIRSGALGPS